MQFEPTGDQATPSDDAESGLRKVLLVDDEAGILDLFGMILRNAGYFVRAAFNGAAGLQVFESASWDLVITDRKMPEMDGERLAEEIKEIAPKTPLILITGFGAEPRPGLFEAVLRKPFSKAVLLGVVEGVLVEEPAVKAPAEA
jgi:CheY-like chemotaxis protein